MTAAARVNVTRTRRVGAGTGTKAASEASLPAQTGLHGPRHYTPRPTDRPTDRPKEPA